jgi:hypothetical protein
MPKKHKKQHYVPASYLKAWCDPDRRSIEEPFVWIFEKDGSGPKRRAPGNILHETDIYTTVGRDGQRKLAMESGLSRLEQSFVRVRNKKLNYSRSLDAEERGLLCVFAAAAHARTPKRREHLRKQWQRPLEMMEDMIQQMKEATPEQRRKMANFPAITPRDDRNTLTYEDVKALVEKPMEMMLLPSIAAEAPLLAQLDMAILETDDDLGFITSDHPCVWSDSKAYTRHPMYRSPALAYETIVITLPLSPRHCLLLNRQNVTGYVPANEMMVDSVNRITRFAAHEHFIARKPIKRDSWFDLGDEPDDSWEKTQAAKRAADAEKKS